MQLPHLASFMQAADAAAKQHRHTHTSDKLAARSVSHIKSAASVVMGAAISSGTFGTVYRAKWQGFDVAVKQLNAFDADAVAALHREALMLMGLSSPHILRVFGLVDQPLGIIMVGCSLLWLNCNLVLFIVLICSLDIRCRSSHHPDHSSTAFSQIARPSLPRSGCKSSAALPTACSCTTLTSSTWTSNPPIFYLN